LSELDNSRRERNFFALQPVRAALSVPAFILAANRRRSRLRQAHSPRHRGAAAGANLGKLPIRRILPGGSLHQDMDPIEETLGNWRQSELQKFPAVSTNRRRGPTASGVFQQQRVVQIALRALRKS